MAYLKYVNYATRQEVGVEIRTENLFFTLESLKFYFQRKKTNSIHM